MRSECDAHELCEVVLLNTTGFVLPVKGLTFQLIAPTE